MIIVADPKVTAVASMFRHLGEVQLVPSDAIDRHQIRHANALIVRSVTRVDDALLDGTNVRFVGTATAGTDHLDLPALARRGITWASAPGANASAVAEYVITTIVEHLARHSVARSMTRVGVVGYGHVGRKVASMLRGLCIDTAICDPPQAEQHADPRWCSLAELFATCNIVTLHTPWTRLPTAHATHHLVSNNQLATWEPTAPLLINTSRGAVVDHDRLFAEALDHVSFALDVWEGEADEIRWPLFDCFGARLVRATPHIAGYTLDAKLEATRRIVTALEAFVIATGGRMPAAPKDSASADEPAAPRRDETSIDLDTNPFTDRDQALAHVLTQMCPLETEDAKLRALVEREPTERAAAFLALRPATPTRRSFAGQPVRLHGPAHAPVICELIRDLQWLGAHVHE